jgi:hypothetical protein
MGDDGLRHGSRRRGEVHAVPVSTRSEVGRRWHRGPRQGENPCRPVSTRSEVGRRWHRGPAAG